MTVGRIPWSAAREYAREELGFEEDLLGPFWLIVSSMDAGFLEWMTSEHKRVAKSNAPASTQVGNRSRSKRSYAR